MTLYNLSDIIFINNRSKKALLNNLLIVNLFLIYKFIYAYINNSLLKTSFLNNF